MDFRRLDAFIFDAMAHSNLPGLSLALVAGEEVIHARGFGQRDLRNGLPATAGTLYSIGSVTKSFTALAILQLAEKGLLDPEDPVDRFLPFPFRPFGEPVTLAHLMSHTSGIPALAYSEALIGHANRTGGRWLPISGPEDVLTFMEGADDWVESKPGERWSYANEGYALLGLIIEKVSGRSYGDYLHSEILEPLGMRRSLLERHDVEADEDVAVPYVLAPGEEPRPGHYLYRRIRSEGGLISSVLDLTRYLKMFLSGGQGVIGSDWLERMLEPRVALPYLTAASMPAQHYAYGLVTETFAGRRLVSHGGSVLVSTAHIAFLPEEGLGVAVLANGSGYPLNHVARAALATALGGEPPEVPAVASALALERLCGHYRSFRGTLVARVQQHGDFLKLYMGSANAQEVVLVPDEPAGREPSFFTYSEGRRLPVTFRLSENGVELLYERYKFRRTGPAQ